MPNLPEQDPNKHAVKHANPVPTEKELPIVAVPGGMPMTTGGYSPDPSRTPQTSIEEDPGSRGVTKPPSGLRR